MYIQYGGELLGDLKAKPGQLKTVTFFLGKDRVPYLRRSCISVYDIPCSA